MKRCVGLFFSLASLALSNSASAQISITADEYYSGLNNSQSASGTSYMDSSSAGYSVMQGLIATTGANQTWDFSTLSYLPVTTNSEHDTIIPYSSGYPGASSFSNATNIIIAIRGIITTYAYFMETSSAAYALGVAQDSAGVPRVVDTYTPPIEEVALPLTYETTWSNSSQITANGQSITYNQYEVVDGYGTLILPGNHSVQCLRLKDDAVYVIPGFGNDTIDIIYSWITTTGYRAGVTNTPGFMGLTQPTYQASYTIPTLPSASVSGDKINPFSARLAANPVSAPTNLYFTMSQASEVRVTIMDVLGNVSTTLMNGMTHNGLNAVRIDPGTLVNGTYFIRIQSAGSSSMQKAVIAK
jgi:hypothetical protein